MNINLIRQIKQYVTMYLYIYDNKTYEQIKISMIKNTNYTRFNLRTYFTLGFKCLIEGEILIEVSRSGSKHKFYKLCADKREQIDTFVNDILL